MLQKMIDFLNPLMQLTNKFGSDNVVTASLVVPMLLHAKRLIDDNINSLNNSQDDRG